MGKENNYAPYISPAVKVIEIDATGVICQSGGINEMNREENQELDW